MEIWVNFEFGDGNFKHGFSKNKLEVTIANAQGYIAQIEVQLAPDEEIPGFYQCWKEEYYSLLKSFRGGFKNNQITHVSKTDCGDYAEYLRYRLDQWLYPIQSELEQVLPQYPASEIRLVIHTKNIALESTKDILHRLPWQEWDFFSGNSSYEAAVCFTSSDISTKASGQSSTPGKIRRARIISIFGDSTNIDTSVDKELLKQLKKQAAELIVLTEPIRSDFNKLWEEAYDILFFAGHSETQHDGQIGLININRNESLSLEEIKSTLRAAINKGLKLAIFNSCNGLGLARQLASLNLPYIIVWREEVPDKLAQKFLQYFLSSFSQGESLFNSVRQARDKLKELADDKDIEKWLPGVSWLPLICQNTMSSPPSWEDFGGLSGELPQCPYQGLSAFRQENADFFFGREKFIANLVEVFKSNQLIPVIGASGSGKSSVVFAGLIPYLQSVGNVGIVSFRPGKNPFDALAIALSKYCQSPVQQTEASGKTAIRLAELEFEVNLRHDETVFNHLVENIINSSGYNHFVLVADQFEELYTLATEKECYSFLNALLFAVNNAPSFTLVLTLRADFLGIVLDYQPMGKVLQQYPLLLLTPMNKEELRDAIEKPALKMKVELEEGLTSRIINNVGDRPGRLPLLEFALTQLWSKQKNWYLTHKAYEEIGGLEKALAKHADEALKNFSEEEKQQAERVFIQLVRPGEGTEDTRRVATRNEVGNENWGLVKRLADERLVVTGWDEIEKIETVEIVHEALIRESRTVREWIEANHEFRIWQERLRQEMRDWEYSDRNPEALLQRTQLAVAEDWYKQRGDELTPLARRFITASIKWRKQEQQKQRRRRQLTTFALTGVLILALMLAGNAWWQSQNSAKSELKAISASSAALFVSNQKLDALREAIRARQKLQKLGNVDENIRNQVELVLRRAVYGAVEYNRLEGHKGEVKSAVFSPDGKTLASTSNDKTVRLWKRDGTLLATFKGHSAGVSDVAISPDGQTLASASEDNTIKLWKRDGTLLVTLKGHQARVSGVAFSPDGQTLASASDDWTVKLWRVSHNKMPVLLTTLKGHENSVNAVAFSPDGNTIASASADKTVKLWKRDGTFLTTVAWHKDTVWDVAISPDGNSIVSASGDNTVKLWNKKGKLLKTLEGHQAGVSSVAISPDGNTIASASWDNTVKLWNKDGTLLTTLNGHSNRVWKVTFSPDSKILASASADETIKFWKLDSELLTTLQGHSASVIGVAISPDGKMVASASDDETVKLWTQDSTLPVTLDLKAAVYRVAFSPDSSTIASASGDKTVKLWNKNGTLLKTLKGHEAGNWGVAFSPDGNTIASAGWDKTVKLWNKNGTLLKTLKGHQEPIWDVAFSPDGNTIASASGDKTVKLWNKNGTLLKTLKAHEAGIWGVAFSPDGNTIASASEDKTVKLWKRDGTLLTTLKEHQSIVFGVAFSPDGRILASASADKTIKLWKVEAGKLPVLLATLNGHSSTVWRVAFSPNGKTLASVSDDKTVILWNLDRVVDLDKVMAYGCNWVRDYLKTNPYGESDRTLCNGIRIQR